MIVRPDDRAVGQVRFDPAPREFTAIISISLDPSARGQGWGSLVIRSACRKLFAETELRKVEAWIRKDNAASQRAFEKAEFKLVRAETIKGQAAVLYELDA
jgi:RimJ/RimL family protein N-acetyltransferase